MQDSTPSRHFCGMFDLGVRYWKDGRDDPARKSAKDKFDSRNAQHVVLVHHETDDVSVLLTCAKVVGVQIASPSSSLSSSCLFGKTCYAKRFQIGERICRRSSEGSFG